MRLYNNISKAVFISRPNRFVVVCRKDGKEISAYLPNPGRLSELFLPGVTLYLEKSPNKARKLPYTVVAVLRDNYPVLLHTHRTNDVAEFLIRRGSVPGLEDAVIIQREKTVGGSRFDFFLSRGAKKILLEVKSCTLFTKRTAMFPDAVTARGRRHVEELAGLKGSETECHVLFVINHPSIEAFIPDFHTDPAFAEALLEAKDTITVTPLAFSIDNDFKVKKGLRVLPVRWDAAKEHNRDCGAYLCILRLRENKKIRVGALGELDFPKGYYTYVGSALKNLNKRMARHKKRGKKLFWHIDYLREEAEFVAILPIRSSDDLECGLAKSMKGLSERSVKGFGASDCACSAHLFFDVTNPMNMRAFHDMLYYFRADRFMKGV